MRTPLYIPPSRGNVSNQSGKEISGAMPRGNSKIVEVVKGPYAGRRHHYSSMYIYIFLLFACDRKNSHVAFPKTCIPDASLIKRIMTYTSLFVPLDEHRP